MKKIAFILLIMTAVISCKNSETKKSIIEKDQFGMTKDGQQVDRYTLTNARGMRVQVITYGGIITSLEVPDREGHFQDVVLGYDNLSDYEENNPFFGALIGRFGNRIADGKFTLEDKEYTLAQNDGKNHLHGGVKGYDKVVWGAEGTLVNGEAVLKLTYLSPDMEEGYPGNLSVEVTYTLTQQNALKVDYKAITDKTTIVNLTQHSYFNLSGGEDILSHELYINADGYLPVDETLIPTGEIAEVKGTPFDFTSAKAIGKDINQDDTQLKRGLGFDHCWVLNDQNTGMRTAAILSESTTGRVLEISTDEPAIQFYSGNFLDGTHPIKSSDSFYGHRSGLCLETQHYPDSPNQEAFPSVVLKPGETYQTQTVFTFTTK